MISPLLANVALDGLERQFGIYSRNDRYIAPVQRRGQDKGVAVFRYAGNFIVTAPSREILAQYVIPKVRDFLSTVGLSNNEAKTQVVNISDGFDFLGFHFQRFCRRDGSIKELMYSPSQPRLDKFVGKLKACVHHGWKMDVKELIRGLNLRIRGFCNYYRWSDAHKAFACLSYRLWELLWRWVRRRHKPRDHGLGVNHYWKVVGGSNWVFSYQSVHLILPWTLTVQWWKWPQVRTDTSPYDPEAMQYWQARQQRCKQRQGAGEIARDPFFLWERTGDTKHPGSRPRRRPQRKRGDTLTEYLGSEPDAAETACPVPASRGSGALP